MIKGEGAMWRWTRRVVFGLITGTAMTPVFAQSAPSSFTTGYRYDQSRQLVGVIQPDPDGSGPLRFPAVRNSYDPTGRLVKVEEGELSGWQSELVAPTSWTGFTIHKVAQFTYNGLDQKTKETVSSGATTFAVTQYSYDSVGRLKCTAVRMDPAQWAGQADACLPQTTGPDGPDRITKNEYNAAGRVAQVREGVGTSIEAAEVTYSYTPNGKREYVIDGEGNRAKYVYDGHDRLSCWAFPSKTKPTSYNGSTQSTALSSAGAVAGDCATTDSTEKSNYEKYTYDANDNRKSLRKRDGRTLTFNYDALKRMTSKVIPNGCPPIPPSTGECPQSWATRNVHYSYNLMGHQLSARFDTATGADRVSNEYNGFGELTSSETRMGGTIRKLTYDHDLNGNRIKLTHPGNVHFTIGYDGIDRANSASWTVGTATTSFMSIKYDSAGRRSQIKRSSSYTDYLYDGASRLKDLTQRFAGGIGNVKHTFGYNYASQIESETRDNDDYAWRDSEALNRAYVVNGLNQYTTSGPVVLKYDANGNLIANGGSRYVYDAENRLVQASNGAELKYDPLGRLWQASKGTDITQFLYDGDQLAVEFDGTGAVKWRYFFGPGIDEPIIADPGGQLACTNGTRFLHANHQGSIVALTDCSGTRQAVNTYDEYGLPNTDDATHTINQNTGRFQDTGQAWLEELGLYYYKARLYSPTLGRFFQVDPVGYEDQINLYAYVGNDPANYIDRDGESRLRSRITLPPGAVQQVAVRAAIRTEAHLRSIDSLYRDPGTYRGPNSASSPVAYTAGVYKSAIAARTNVGFGTNQSPLSQTPSANAVERLIVASRFEGVRGGRGIESEYQFHSASSQSDVLKSIAAASGQSIRTFNGRHRISGVEMGNGITAEVTGYSRTSTRGPGVQIDYFNPMGIRVWSNKFTTFGW